MTGLLRWLGSAVLIVVAIRVLDWFLAPALPLLVLLFMMTLTARVLFGRRGL
jgi:hypothetical protein